MAGVKQKTVVTMKVTGACQSHSLTEVSARDIKIMIDEPVDRGGTNQGPSPTETLLAALAGCTNRIGHKVAEANGVGFLEMKIEIEAKFDRRGVALSEDIDVPFPEITTHIDVLTNANDEAIERVKRDLPKYCPISKVIRQSGTNVTDVWTIRRP